MLSETNPITAIGQNCPSNKLNGVPSRNTPRKTAIKYRIGLINVIFCTSSGMFLMGVAKPDKMMDGTKKMNAPNSPCCCVAANDEIINPTPTPDSKKSMMPV